MTGGIGLYDSSFITVIRGILVFAVLSVFCSGAMGQEGGEPGDAGAAAVHHDDSADALGDADLEAFVYDGTDEYKTVITAPSVKPEPVKYHIDTEMLSTMPGTAGDALKAVHALPGVGQSFNGEGPLIVRGSRPADTRYFLNHLSLPVVFHMDSANTLVVSSRLLESVDFYPGNFSVRFGDAMGGIINFVPRAGDATRYTAGLDANSRHAGFYMEAPLGENGSWTAAARHSYSAFDDVYRSAFQSDDYPVETDYRFYDYQGVVQYGKSARNRLNVYVLGSDDDRTIVLHSRATGETIKKNKGVGFHRVQLEWSRDVGKHATDELALAVEYQRTEPELMTYERFILKAVPLYLRNELTLHPDERMDIRLGLVSMQGYAWWDVMEFSGEGYTGSTPFVFPAAYAETTLYPFDDFSAVSGLRVSLAPRIMRIAVDPRFAVQYHFGSRTTFRAGFGVFHQPPSNEEQDADYGNENLKMSRAIHYGVGFEHQLSRRLEVNLEGFYRVLTDLVVPGDNTDRTGEWENFNNDGRAKVLGAEMMLRHRPSSHFSGWLSYTLMKATGQDHNENVHPTEGDQRHVLTAVASWKLPRGWVIGTKFQLASGRPYTPVVGREWREEYGAYLPLYGEKNSATMPLFHQLDIRGEKKFSIQRLACSVYLDLENVYNQRTPQFYYYFSDSTRRYAYSPNHFYPNLGLTAAW